MKKYISGLALIVIAILMLISCNNTLLPVRIPTGDPKIPANDIAKDIPRYDENNKVYLYYKLAKQKQRQLKLTVPENGYDSLLLRLWFVYPQDLFQFGEMVEIKYSADGTAKANYTKMRIFFNPTRDYENVNSHRDSLITIPKGGWQNFSDTLRHLKIVDLPTIEHIPFYRSQVTGLGYDNNYMTVACEIATKDKYRFIQYNNFEEHKNISQVKQMYDFVRFLRTELGMTEIDKGWYGEGDTEERTD